MTTNWNPDWGRFWRDEEGASTVEWVLITAAAAGLGLAVTGAVGTGANNQAGMIDDRVEISTSF